MSVVVPIYTLSGEYVPIANIIITDTSTHSYLTDPPSDTSEFGINLIHLGDILGSGNNTIKTYSLWIYNGTDQTLTVQPIGNVVSDGSYPDYTLDTAVSVDAGVTSSLKYPFVNYPVEYISTNLSFNTAPTNGGVVYVVLFIYYG